MFRTFYYLLRKLMCFSLFSYKLSLFLEAWSTDCPLPVFWRFLLLWSAVLIMYPTTLAVIALTFSSYILQPVFPDCVPPYVATRLLSATCLSKCLHQQESELQRTVPTHDICQLLILFPISILYINIAVTYWTKEEWYMYSATPKWMIQTDYTIEIKEEKHEIRY